MSGIDEQFQGMPKCSICGKEPDYWILETTIDANISGHYHDVVRAWLFNEGYFTSIGKYYQYKHVGIGDKHYNVKVAKFVADYITSAEASCHSVKKHFAGPIFNTVKRAVSYWLKKEGFGSEWNR